VARLGLDYKAVRSLRHDIVYASLSGFGQHGPYSRRGAVDALMQGFSGMMVMNRTPDGACRIDRT
jgi:crotonobetainyl-CoA:carnitine CoA-transferase CaiB-like acyl-CoA transferase